MSGGIAYALDEDGTFGERCNLSMVQIEPLLSEGEQEGKVPSDLWHLGQSDEAIVRAFLDKHARYTGSAQAKRILEHSAQYRSKFVKVFPNEYRRALGEIANKGGRLAA